MRLKTGRSIRPVLAILILPAFGALPTHARQAPVAEAQVAPRVFVAGHSFHVPISKVLNQIGPAEGTGRVKLAGSQIIGGSSVTQHWELTDERDKARKAIKAGEVDVLTLSPFLTPLPDPAIEKFTELLLKHNPKGRVTVQASWFPMDGPYADRKTFQNTQRDQADPDVLRKAWAPTTERMRENVKVVNSRFAESAGRQVVFLVPVSDAVIRLRERISEGEVPGVARQSELFRDNLGHGKELITLLTAYCHYAVIEHASPVGLPTPEALKAANLGENTDRVNRILEEIAWEAATSEPLSGVYREVGDLPPVGRR